MAGGFAPRLLSLLSDAGVLQMLQENVFKCGIRRLLSRSEARGNLRHPETVNDHILPAEAPSMCSSSVDDLSEWTITLCVPQKLKTDSEIVRKMSSSEPVTAPTTNANATPDTISGVPIVATTPSRRRAVIRFQCRMCGRAKRKLVEPCASSMDLII